MKRFWIVLSAAALAAAVAVFAPAFADDADVGTIRQMMIAQFDRPDARLTVEPVTVHGDIAVAGWAQGNMGGRALLRRQNHQWQLVLCSGDALKEAKALQQFGLSAKEAEDMAKAVAAAEGKLDPALVAKFSTFDGFMRMDEDGHHPPVNGHGNHKG
jgi:hypothetical protein